MEREAITWAKRALFTFLASIRSYFLPAGRTRGCFTVAVSLQPADNDLTTPLCFCLDYHSFKEARAFIYHVSPPFCSRNELRHLIFEVHLSVINQLARLYPVLLFSAESGGASERSHGRHRRSHLRGGDERKIQSRQLSVPQRARHGRGGGAHGWSARFSHEG